MSKRFLVPILVVVALLIALIGGYFLAERLGIIPKNKFSYTQPLSVTELEKEALPEVVIESPSQSQENIESQQLAVIGDQNNTKSEKIEQPVTPEKIVEKKTETAKPVETKGEAGKIVDKLISWGFTKSSDRKIDTIIVHSSYDALGSDPFSVSGIIAEYKQYGVSAHYLIARDGVIYRLVSDQNIAWHAGVSKMPDGRTAVNEFSIGVEMINTQDGKYTDEQYSALNSLIASLKNKYPIKNILGHNEIAPGRKTDPWNINWGKVNR